MRVYNYSEARQNFSNVLDVALGEDVVISRKDGIRFRLVPMKMPMKRRKSLLENIKGVNANVTMGDILESLKERN